MGHLANASSFQPQVPLILKYLTAYSEAHPSQQTTAAKGNIRSVRIAFAPLSACHPCLSPCRSPVVSRRPRQHAQALRRTGRIVSTTRRTCVSSCALHSCGRVTEDGQDTEECVVVVPPLSPQKRERLSNPVVVAHAARAGAARTSSTASSSRRGSMRCCGCHRHGDPPAELDDHAIQGQFRDGGWPCVFRRGVPWRVARAHSRDQSAR